MGSGGSEDVLGLGCKMIFRVDSPVYKGHRRREGGLPGCIEPGDRNSITTAALRKTAYPEMRVLVPCICMGLHEVLGTTLPQLSSQKFVPGVHPHNWKSCFAKDRGARGVSIGWETLLAP